MIFRPYRSASTPQTGIKRQKLNIPKNVNAAIQTPSSASDVIPHVSRMYTGTNGIAPEKPAMTRICVSQTT